RGEGQIAVQLQGGMDTDQMWSPNTLCYLDQHEDGPVTCVCRIASDERGKPIFARVPIIFHRPLPRGRVKWCYVERRMLADRERWSVRFTIDTEPDRAHNDTSG